MSRGADTAIPQRRCRGPFLCIQDVLLLLPLRGRWKGTAMLPRRADTAILLLLRERVAANMLLAVGLHPEQ